jgi:hypothetical protein
VSDAVSEGAPPEESTPGTAMSYIAGIGVDVGQKQDPSAIAVAELRWLGEGHERQGVLYVRHLEALPLGTPWADVARRVAAVASGVADRLYGEWRLEYERRQITAASVFASEYEAENGPVSPPTPQVYLRVDATGVGSPIVDLIESALHGRGAAYTRVQPCFFTHGDKLTRSGKTFSVGKGFLVGRLKALQQAGLLKIAPGILDAEAVVDEFLDYEIRVDERANERYGAFRTGAHDDRVTALGLAVLVEPPRRAYAGTVSVDWD